MTWGVLLSNGSRIGKDGHLDSELLETLPPPGHSVVVHETVEPFQSARVACFAPRDGAHLQPAPCQPSLPESCATESTRSSASAGRGGWGRSTRLATST